jgi:quercetin dioxygenase-like cupin family protein
MVTVPKAAGRTGVEICRLLPTEIESFAEPFHIEVQPGAKIVGHFFQHKGQEIGYLESGALVVRLKEGPEPVQAGDLIYLEREMPAGWENPGREAARLLWFKF